MPGSDESWNIMTPYLNGQANDPSLWQRAWASPLGRLAQGGIADPILGAPQLMSHIMAWADPQLSSYRTMMDNTVNSVDQSYNKARMSAGQNPYDGDWVREVGGVATAFTPWGDFLEGPEAATAAGKLISGMTSAAATSTLTKPEDTSEGQSYVRQKSSDAVTEAFVDPAIQRAKALFGFLGS